VYRTWQGAGVSQKTGDNSMEVRPVLWSRTRRVGHVKNM